MSTFGLTLLMGGAALLISGLRFLLPLGRKEKRQLKTFEESIDRLDFHLSEMRRELRDR